MTVIIGEARDALSSLVECADKGEHIVIALRGKPVMRLVPCEEAAWRLASGWGKHLPTASESALLDAL